MSRLERHIADYARAIEDADGMGRATEHLELCKHLGVGHDELQPFEGVFFFAGYSHVMPRAQAAKIIRDAVEKLMAEKVGRVK